MSLNCILKQTWQGQRTKYFCGEKAFTRRVTVLASGYSVLCIFQNCESLTGTQMGLGPVLGPGRWQREEQALHHFN